MDTNDFLLKDYELKIRYLTDHLSRMWQRFNYMLSIQTAIAGGKFFLYNDTNGPDFDFGFIGLIFAIIWYLLGAQDRYLFELYRKQVAQSFAYLKAEIAPKERSHVGQVDDAPEAKEIKKGVMTWRIKGISSTKLAAIVPLVIICLWLYLIIKL